MPEKSQKDEELVNSQKANGSQRPKQGIELYSNWFASLPLPEQQALLRKGLGPEAREGDGNYTFEVNPDHSAYATLDPQYEDYIEPPEQRTYTEDEVQEVIRRIVMAMQMSESPDCLFQARCILIAFGIGDPPTETELAKQKDCSRQFVSKKVKRIQQMFNLAPSQFMRSEAACEAYSLAWQRLQERKNTPQVASKKPSKRSVLINSQDKHMRPAGRPHNRPRNHNKDHPPLPTPPSPHPPLRNLLSKTQGVTGSLDTAPKRN